jgi:hypothetical protein
MLPVTATAQPVRRSFLLGRQNGLMSWRPPAGPTSHRLAKYNLQVATLHDSAGALAGHALVEQETVWPQSGALWWKRWGAPQHHTVVYLSLHGAFEERYVWPEEAVDAAVANWERGRWVEMAEDGTETTYSLAWVSQDESVAVAQRELGMDIAWLRKQHRHSD